MFPVSFLQVMDQRVDPVHLNVGIVIQVIFRVEQRVGPAAGRRLAGNEQGDSSGVPGYPDILKDNKRYETGGAGCALERRLLPDNEPTGFAFYP